MKKLKVGIVGCGVIGTEIAKACATILKERLEVVSLFDIVTEKAVRISNILKKRNIVVTTLPKLFKRSELVIEAASNIAAKAIVKKTLRKPRLVLVMSVGGLINEEPLLKEANERGIHIYMPSGAICGIDGLKGGRMSRIKRVILRTKKPPKSLKDAPYLKEKNINVNAIKEEKVIFKGNAHAACRGFPQNINVAALLSLAGVGAKKTIVEIVASPTFTKNVHEVEITGDFGRITTRTENVPFEKNPKTSKLAALSAIATLKGIVESVRIGT